MNIARLKRLESFFRTNPYSVDMSEWGQVKDNLPHRKGAYIPLRDVGTLVCHTWERSLAEVKCDTLACIAGWTVLLFWAKRPVLLRRAVDTVRPAFIETAHFLNVGDLACTLLELDKYQRQRLFFLDSWPTAWRNIYDQTPPARKGNIVADYIAAFIESKGDIWETNPLHKRATYQETYL